MDFKTFQALSKTANLIPIYREILADMETPVLVLTKLQSQGYAFLLESMEGGEKWGRYTFIGADPCMVYKVRGSHIFIEENGQITSHPHGGHPLQHLRQILRDCRPAFIEGLPRFYGGAVGFLGYDIVRYFECLPTSKDKRPEGDDAVFLITNAMIIFDSVRHTIKVVACARIQNDRDLRTVYEDAISRIDNLVKLLATNSAREEHLSVKKSSGHFHSGIAPEDFKAAVRRAKEYILAGDIIQVVLSQRFERDNGVDPINLYRALRFINPSPYLFFLKLGEMFLIGSSPEVMVRLEEGMVELKPIAGTKHRGRTEQEDRKLADELLRDPKERAEHVMLVDLGRNDLGRIARTGSVQVNQLMAVERYSHVMHLVSHIQAQLAEGKDAFDVLRATFPAGTLSGAPKVRAMEIMEELEPERRGTYGGAVGYFSFSGNMDFCITIRTLLVRDEKIFVQAGAGIVADSDPEAEYRETINKAQAMMQAVCMAEEEL
jgi:anthranilate synthase component 1